MQNSIISYLEKSAERFPAKPAYCDEKRELTFLQLQTEARAIGSRIIATGIFKKPVLIFLEKSVECLSCFMGVAYSGNFYTPIDTTMPTNRIEKIVEKLCPALVLTDRNSLETVRNFAPETKILLYEEAVQTQADEGALTRTQAKVTDTDLLYVLFTSGSTGMPKGVTISHRAVMDFTEAVAEQFDITEKERFANQGNFYFDLSVLDIYCTLYCGATMFITPPSHFKFPIKLLQYIQEKQINAIFWVPSALVLVANLRALKAVDVSCLKKVMFCGEVMPAKQLNMWKKYLPDALYVNMYGPTETTCASTYYVFDREFTDDDSLPIGIPFQNTRILLLTEEDKLAKADETGEICIAGSGLSFGYYNDYNKTKEAFVQNPLQADYAETIYRTGDLGRYNERGELMYLSRKDFQIKHMGHRIELGEIETAMTSLKEITECCCVYDGQRKKIVAYLVSHIGQQEVEAHLKERLQEYMLPNKYVYLETMPHNANGKIDRAYLNQLIKEKK